MNNFAMLLPLIMKMKGNENMNEVILELIGGKMKSDGENNKSLDPMTIMLISLIGNMNKKSQIGEKTDNEQNENIVKKSQSDEKTPNLSAIENFSPADITEALKILINNQNQ